MLNITIGALLDITGPDPDEGIVTAMQVALGYLNQLYNTMGSEISFNLMVEDDAGDTNLAITRLNVFVTKGINIIVGPSSSQLLGNIYSTIAQKNIVVISLASTSPYLSIPNDNIFRLWPDDSQQAKVSAIKLEKDGVRNVIVLLTDDSYGQAYLEQFKAYWTAGPLFSLPVNSTNLADQLLLVEEAIEGSIQPHGSTSNPNQQGPGKYGVLLIVDIETGVNIFHHAANDTKYKQLRNIMWIGTDSMAQGKALVEDKEASKFAIAVNFSASVFSIDPTTSTYQQALNALHPNKPFNGTVFLDSRELTAWDSVFLIGKLFAGSRGQGLPPDLTRMALSDFANSSYGASGWLALNQNGDRAEDVFDF